MRKHYLLACVVFFTTSAVLSQGTRLLRQPSISDRQVVFTYGADVWISDLNGGNLLRLTSTAAVESNPRLSPDGKWVAFTSNRSGSDAVYIVPATGGSPVRLTWHPAPAVVRGWTPDGKRILYASSRETAPTSFTRLWTVSSQGGPSTLLSQQWGSNGSFNSDGSLLALERVDRWDEEWRNYRGGQNTPLIILNLADQSEKLLPYASTVDIQPVWLGDKIYFLSDRDWTSNIWSYAPATGELKQLTQFSGADVKTLGGYGNQLVFEREGLLQLYDLTTGNMRPIQVTINADFPWAEEKWEDVTGRATNESLSPTGKRIVMEARGEIFTVPVEHGDARNITQSSGVADRRPIWSPKGGELAWFSDQDGKGYALMIAAQDGLSKPRAIALGESKLGWEPVWSPDGKLIAFVDDDVRVRIVDVQSGTVKTVDVGGTNIERGDMSLTWSPDSKWLAYAKMGSNNFHRIVIWSTAEGRTREITNPFADSYAPAWDRDGHHLYFLASTSLALGSGWANTSSMGAHPTYSAYVINLRKDDQSPFKPKSDEETVEEKKKEEPKTDKKAAEKKPAEEKDKSKEPEPVLIDFDGIERRTVALSIPEKEYRAVVAGPSGTVFIGEWANGADAMTVHKFTLEKNEAKEFTSGIMSFSVSADGNKMLVRAGKTWKVVSTAGASADGAPVNVSLQMKLSRTEEWKQMFEEAWRYERDYFYDPNMHGRNWNEVHDRYAPLVPYIRHRADLTYILDQVNGELSVGHSFVFGGDFPEVQKISTGLLGADLVPDKGRWKIARIYTTESWNPELSSPLDRPGIKVQEGYYLVGINGKELRDTEDPYQFLDGTQNRQTVLHLNKTPDFAGHWQEIVKPIGSENSLRQRAWVEDNRRIVDKLSAGKLAYVWVPNTGGQGYVSFNRYYFAQQDKQGAVIDERFNGGGLLDDYMTDLMNRRLRAAITNEVPNGTPFKLPAGILGPKVLLVNELAGSGGDFFPWVFRHQKTGPLIGARTWGGLVKSSVHYALVDGGALTAPDNAVFDPITKKWVAENEGVAPDIEVRQDAQSLTKGIDPQLERAVREALKLLEQEGNIVVTPPAYSTPAKKK
ncbi:MAG: PDZ domain-containing protein [Cyclobacteriaceae bacterium]